MITHLTVSNYRSVSENVQIRFGKLTVLVGPNGSGKSNVMEEPELTVHPGAIPLLYDHLKQATRRSQVIVTMHSPEFLDLVDPDEVRVVMRNEGETVVAPMLASQRDAVKSGLMTLGEVMRSEGLQQELPFAAAE